MWRHYYAASTPQTAKQQSVVFPAAANPNLMKRYLGGSQGVTKIKSIVEQEPVSTNFTFLVWSDLTYDQPFSYVFSHFGHGNKHPNTKPGDPRVSLLLTSEKAVFWK